MANKQGVVCLRLKGGIGNQLFEFAFARALSIKLNYKLIIDTKTGYMLDAYKRNPRIADFLLKYKEASNFIKLLFYLNKIFPKLIGNVFKTKFLKENDSRQYTNINIDKIRNQVKLLFIEGYFQSFEYFDFIKDNLRNDFIFKLDSSELVKHYLSKINDSNSVSIHVRRVDYVDKLEVQYYENGINYVVNRLNSPLFFIFSDDLKWCKNHFDYLPNKIYIEGNEEDEITDLWLMIQCKHHIIANSSFSWWGAWLSTFIDKIVVAPKQTSIGVENKIYPKQWVLI